MNWALIASAVLLCMAFLVTAHYVYSSWHRLDLEDRIYFIVITIFGWYFTACLIKFLRRPRRAASWTS